MKRRRLPFCCPVIIYAQVRTCTDCGQTKPLEAFTAIQGTPYRHGRCKSCRADRARDARPLRLVAPKPGKPVKSGPRPKEPSGVRTCSECGETKQLEAFLRIASSQNGYYGRCRVCRAIRNKQRYYGSPETLEVERARSRRNMRALRLRRRLQDTAALERPQ